MVDGCAGGARCNARPNSPNRAPATLWRCQACVAVSVRAPAPAWRSGTNNHENGSPIASRGAGILPNKRRTGWSGSLKLFRLRGRAAATSLLLIQHSVPS